MMVIQSAKKEEALEEQVSDLSQKLKESENLCDEMTREKAQLRRQIDTLESKFSHGESTCTCLQISHWCVTKKVFARWNGQIWLFCIFIAWSKSSLAEVAQLFPNGSFSSGIDKHVPSLACYLWHARRPLATTDHGKCSMIWYTGWVAEPSVESA